MTFFSLLYHGKVRRLGVSHSYHPRFWLSIVLIVFGIHCPEQFLNAQEGFRLKKMVFTGNETFSDSKLKKQIVMRPSSGLRRILFWKKPYRFSENVLQRDINRLLRFYQTEGFLQAKIMSSINTDEEHESVNVNFDISESDAILVQDIYYQITAEDSLNELRVRNVLNSILSSFSLTKEKRYRDALVRADQKTILNTLANQGYPYCEVRTEFRVDHDANIVDITFHVSSGLYCYFGDTNISGNNKTPELAINNQMAFKKGDVFNQELIQKSQRRIYQLGVFQYVTVKTVMNEEQTNIIPVQILIKEAPRLTSKIGIGYGREDKFRISLDMRKLGFLGGARRLTLFAKHSYLEPYHLSLKFVQPAFLYPKASLVLNPFIRQEKEPGFTIDRVGANVTFQQRFATYTDGYLSYSLEQDNLEVSRITREQALNDLDITLYNKSSVTIGLARDNSAPPMFPMSGMYTSGTLTLSGVGFKSDFHYLRLLLELRRYHSLINGWILAYRAKVGAMGSTRENEITPIEERFYSGGSASVRGWARSQLGPMSEEDRPIGGNSYLEGSIELRYPIWKWISGVYFIDIGNVWRPTLDYELTELHYAAGLGLRFKTPIGPVRFDVATPIFEKRLPVQFHMTVGQAF